MLTMSIFTGLYPTLDLWNANKLHYMTAGWHGTKWMLLPVL